MLSKGRAVSKADKAKILEEYGKLLEADPSSRTASARKVAHSFGHGITSKDVKAWYSALSSRYEHEKLKIIATQKEVKPECSFPSSPKSDISIKEAMLLNEVGVETVKEEESELTPSVETAPSSPSAPSQGTHTSTPSSKKTFARNSGGRHLAVSPEELGTVFNLFRQKVAENRLTGKDKITMREAGLIVREVVKKGGLSSNKQESVDMYYRRQVYYSNESDQSIIQLGRLYLKRWEKGRGIWLLYSATWEI